MTIHPFNPKDLDSLSQITHKLHPNWFDTNALKNIPLDAQLGKTYIAKDNDQVVGIIIITSLEGKTWLNWIGVDPNFQGRGVGTLLLKHAINFLTQISVKALHVDTVVEQTPADGTYDQTIKWYYKNDFQLIKAKPARLSRISDHKVCLLVLEHRQTHSLWFGIVCLQ